LAPIREREKKSTIQLQNKDKIKHLPVTHKTVMSALDLLIGNPFYKLHMPKKKLFLAIESFPFCTFSGIFNVLAKL